MYQRFHNFSLLLDDLINNCFNRDSFSSNKACFIKSNWTSKESIEFNKLSRFFKNNSDHKLSLIFAILVKSRYESPIYFPVSYFSLSLFISATARACGNCDVKEIISS